MKAKTRDLSLSFCEAVNDLTEHQARVGRGNVEVVIRATEYNTPTLNELGKIVRAYGMEFGSGVVAEGTTMLTFVEPDD